MALKLPEAVYCVGMSRVAVFGFDGEEGEP